MKRSGLRLKSLQLLHCLTPNLVQHRGRGEWSAFDVEFELSEGVRGIAKSRKLLPKEVHRQDAIRGAAEFRRGVYDHLDSVH